MMFTFKKEYVVSEMRRFFMKYKKLNKYVKHYYKVKFEN